MRSALGHRGILVAALLAMAAGATRVEAIVVVDSKTGLFGLTAGQTVRINVLNTGAGRVGGIVPCFGVFDMAGTLLAEFEAGAPVPPGQGTFFDFDASRLGLRAGQRAQVRVEVELVGSNPPGDTTPPDPNQPPDPTQPPDPNRRIRPDDAIVTVEVFDNDTGKTMFVLPVVLKGFNPQPEPPAAVR